MRTSSFILCLVPALLLSVACEKENEKLPGRKLGYFPVEPGNSVTYKVRRMEHDSALQKHDTDRYFIRRKITETFIDNEGRQSYRVERFRKDSMKGQWKIQDVWVANRNRKRAELVEENRRFTKLVFPIDKGKRWDGNAYNDLPEQEYKYRDIHNSRTIGGEKLDSTVKVLQKDVENLIQRKFMLEVYAMGIGMVKKEDIDLETYTNGAIRKGTELYMRMIDQQNP